METWLTVTPRTVQNVVRRGGYWGRSEIAEALGRKKTTHVIETIERAVRMGLIHKLEGQDSQGRFAWVYTIEIEQLSLAGITDHIVGR